MKHFYLALLLTSNLYISNVYADIDVSELQSLADFTDQVMEQEKFSTLESEAKIQLLHAQPNIQKILDAKKITYNDSVYLHNYAIITSQYAEYLLNQNCSEASIPYQQQTEKAYQRILKYNPKDKTALNNFGLFYAQMSVYYRKNTDPTQRLAYLVKSEKLFAELLVLSPQDNDYKRNYNAVLSDKLMLLQKYNQDLNEQKRIIDILKKPLFQYLANPNQTFDAGNFLILVQQYFKHLNKENSKLAQKWLSDHQTLIETIVQKNQKQNQREAEFLAEFYALLGQNERAMSYLKKIELSDDNDTEPSTLENEPNLDNLKSSPEYQKWFKQYKQDYEQYRKAIPQVCKVNQLEMKK